MKDPTSKCSLEKYLNACSVTYGDHLEIYFAVFILVLL